MSRKRVAPLATYTYDAWGKILAENEDSSIAGLNPFRYRGYVYDNETGLYYLQSRYYDPETGRFINADAPEYTDTNSGTPLSTNMFAYCENNAVNECDYTGFASKNSFETYAKSRWNNTTFGDKKIKIKIQKNKIKIIAKVNITGSLKDKTIKVNGKEKNIVH